MGNTVDLHIHSTFSDGLSSPEDILKIVRQKKLAAFSICDHDNFGGYMAIRKLIGPGDPELIPGIELSAGAGGEDIHILGYYFDVTSKIFADAVENFREKRNQRGALMLNKLKNLGIEVPMDMVRKFAGDSAIGRPHVADALVKVGAAGNFNEAFDKYIGSNAPAYVPKENLAPKDAMDLIHQAGGLAVLAHPGISNVVRYIDEFVKYGLDGIEVYHSAHNRGTKKMLKTMAAKNSLLISGGSDYHGREELHEMIGTQNVPAIHFENLKIRWKLKPRG